MTDYLDDKSNRLIGWATMRQLRIRQSQKFTSTWLTISQSFFSLFQ